MIILDPKPSKTNSPVFPEDGAGAALIGVIRRHINVIPEGPQTYLSVSELSDKAQRDGFSRFIAKKMVNEGLQSLEAARLVETRKLFLRGEEVPIAYAPDKALFR